MFKILSLLEVTMIHNGLSIIVPTLNREKIFNKTLHALFQATIEIPHEVIVINDSKDSVPKIPEEYLGKIKLYNNPKKGLASVRNFGLQLASFEYILFIDNDIIIQKNTIHELIKLSIKHPRMPINFNWTYPDFLINKANQLQFGRYMIKNGFTSLKGYFKNSYWDDGNTFSPQLIAGFFLLITKTTINEVGGYHDLFPPTAEDFEFAVNLNKKNIKGLVDPTNIVFHNEEDRVDLQSWLKRQEHGAETKRVSVNFGYLELEMKVNKFKKNINAFFYHTKTCWFLFLKLIPNFILFDPIYFSITNRLFAAHLQHGYYKKQVNDLK